jgi:ATP-dependent helicase/nuclease subunit A
MIDDAAKDQNIAANPHVSTWLSANAGSGKTRVLTDRVARLLLHGVDPQNVLCLTYTKAAASEMQNRLFKRLGEWSMLDDALLREELAKLGETPPDRLSNARTLFARAIETPGGLKIQTIHSFCASVLRQFPLEAGVSPQFREMDDAGTKDVIEGVLDELARTMHPSLDPIARLYSGETLFDLAKSIVSHAENFRSTPSQAEIFGRFRVPANMTRSGVVDAALSVGDLAFLKSVAPVIATSASANDQKLAAALSSLPDTPSLAAIETLEGQFLTGASAAMPFSSKAGSLPTKSFRENVFAPHLPRFETIIERIADARPLRIGLLAAEATQALHDFAAAFLAAYKTAKEDRGVLDFDDLIQKTRDLLTDRSMAWVLYRLDGGLEHILIDEAQDTSPTQWTVVKALADEITAGQGARAERNRTLFVVGDKKQSIYSFQGADARVFDGMAETFSKQLLSSQGLFRRDLQYSFRSSTAILTLVDGVFDTVEDIGIGLNVRHRAVYPTLPGRVDLWPLEPKPEKEATPEWHDPVDRTVANAPSVVLADKIAANIRWMLDFGTIPDENGKSRRIGPRDILILVQGRSELFDQIIRACKAQNLPMAGADRLKIGAVLAVKDLLALLSFLALPEDDLSLAATLRSPIFGWSEARLYDLAQGRGGTYLWATLRDRKHEFAETFQILSALRKEVDFLRPYELLELILTRYDARRRLLARLGPEAEDGINELLNQALTFEGDTVPGLTAFLIRAKSDDIEIKRQSDTSSGLIRVMTVHGAKGLESPIVILPDTTRADSRQADRITVGPDGFPMWSMSANDNPDIVQEAKRELKDADREERQRLLYVAMTRAAQWLIVCGVDSGPKDARNWYASIDAGMRRLSPEVVDTPTGKGLRIGHGVWSDPMPDKASESVTDKGEIPEFLLRNPPMQTKPVTPVSPSDLGGAKVLGGGALPEDEALRRGSQIHLLLENIPSDAADPEDLGRRILASEAPTASPEEAAALIGEALRNIRAHPDIFAPGALVEVDIAAHLPSLDCPLVGTIDRLIVGPDRILAVDFKTNAVVPASPETTPEGLLRQMGAYLEALEQIWPEHEIELAILWTAAAELMPMPHAIVREALMRTTTS